MLDSPAPSAKRSSSPPETFRLEEASRPRSRPVDTAGSRCRPGREAGVAAARAMTVVVRATRTIPTGGRGSHGGGHLPGLTSRLSAKERDLPHRRLGRGGARTPRSGPPTSGSAWAPGVALSGVLGPGITCCGGWGIRRAAARGSRSHRSAWRRPRFSRSRRGSAGCRAGQARWRAGRTPRQCQVSGWSGSGSAGEVTMNACGTPRGMTTTPPVDSWRRSPARSSRMSPSRM